MTEETDHKPGQGPVPAQSSEGASASQHPAPSPPPGHFIPAEPAPGYGQQPPTQSYPAQQPPMQGYAAPVYAQQPMYVQAPTMGMVQVGPDKSVGVAYLLLIFLGIFGAHQFYLDKIGRGVGYFFTLGWLTIGLWIDLFTLASQVRAVNTQRRMGIR